MNKMVQCRGRVEDECGPDDVDREGQLAIDTRVETGSSCGALDRSVQRRELNAVEREAANFEGCEQCLTYTEVEEGINAHTEKDVCTGVGGPETRSSDPSRGSVIDPSLAEFRGNERFDVLSRLGEGGMGVVYEAFDRELGVRVALKGLRVPDLSAIWRFKHEFRALRDVRHPNLIRFGELFEEAGKWFFTMELVEGTDFLTYVRGADGGGGDKKTRECPTAPPLNLTQQGGVGRSSPGPSLASCNGQRNTLPTPTQRFDEKRLRHALKELAQGLIALHGEGRIHRDLKPSNIMVDGKDRVVILDFGVVAELARGENAAGELAGTIGFMAPEQARCDTVGPACDWYAVGTLLYLVLRGRLPFVGNLANILAGKQHIDPRPPSEFTAGVPDDLERLCLALLQRDPAKRATAEDVLATLGAEAAGVSETSAVWFVGRRAEIRQIVETFLDKANRVDTAVFIEGPSGIGKSVLMTRAIEQIRVLSPDVLVLHGRCHVRESVPYNAFDGVIDELATTLQSSGRMGVNLIPEDLDTGALMRVFPALWTVERLAIQTKSQIVVGSTPEIRRNAVAALRRLLAQVGRHRPLVLAVDDSHWADVDSLSLLEDLLRADESLPMLFIGTARPNNDGACCCAVRAAGERAQVIKLQGLGPEEARTLAEHLLASRHHDPQEVDSLVSETEGHPMFIDELARYAKLADRTRPLQLDEALASRVATLAPMARHTLEVVVCGDVPIAHGIVQGIVTRVAGAQESTGIAPLDVLRDARLVRMRGPGFCNAVEPYHDRIRQAVYERIPDARRAPGGRNLMLGDGSARP